MLQLQGPHDAVGIAARVTELVDVLQVAFVVSGINLSNYCLASRLEILGRLGIDKKQSRKLALDYTTADVATEVMELLICGLPKEDCSAYLSPERNSTSKEKHFSQVRRPA
jgi:hypothetical protein